MLTKLVRISARIPWQVICSRQITNHTSKRTLPVIFNINKPQVFSGNSISGIRSFSDQVKLDKSQIEEKILEIIKNFDRVKENPANPQVNLFTQTKKFVSDFYSKSDRHGNQFNERSGFG